MWGYSGMIQCINKLKYDYLMYDAVDKRRNSVSFLQRPDKTLNICVHLSSVYLDGS